MVSVLDAGCAAVIASERTLPFPEKIQAGCGQNKKGNAHN
jgi:hypothetical protein